jgi:hypothetical protein
MAPTNARKVPAARTNAEQKDAEQENAEQTSDEQTKLLVDVSDDEEHRAEDGDHVAEKVARQHR